VLLDFAGRMAGQDLHRGKASDFAQFVDLLNRVCSVGVVLCVDRALVVRAKAYFRAGGVLSLRVSYVCVVM
jgi:hypothetical protein